ncbi:hypothetical protein [Curtobacterium ammoniigenes]|uniref:hypothetical protein n=1 Tax=Curtobacterium ammoniigenes TaxID=395387 RepID=UPI0008353745|nr:hypothetical protein [Curtobacterium ammoniigenes]
MTLTFTLPDAAAAEDLRTYLERAARVEDGSARLIVASGVLAAYTAIIYPVGLLDEAPTVLGLRTAEVAQSADFDVVVPLRSLLERIRNALDASAGVSPIEVGVPLQVGSVTWAAITPPRTGWVPLPTLSVDSLRQAARAGMSEVAEALPPSSGDALVRRVRAAVWGRQLTEQDTIPAGAAFAAESLGFLSGAEERVRVFESGPWRRLTTAHGHVLAARRAWSSRA